MKIIIAGGRLFSDYPFLKLKCDNIIGGRIGIEIVSGTAKGADKLGERYAKEKGFYISEFPANWDDHGKKAGYLRNDQMAQYADALIAFWDGTSSGTKHMIDLANERGLKVRVIKY